MEGIMKFRVLLLAALVALFSWANSLVQPGDFMEGALTNQTDPFLQMSNYVRGLYPDLYGAEVVSLILNFPNGLSRAGLDQLSALSAQLETAFGKRVVSLATLPRYKDRGDQLLTASYLSE